MVIADKESGLLAVYERPDDLSTEFDPERLHRYTIEKSKYSELIEEILKAVDDFEADLLKVKEDPFISEEDLLPADISDITSRILALEYQISQIKEIEEKLEADKSRLFEVMSKTGVKSWKTPNGYTITRVDGTEDKRIETTYFDEDAFKEADPKEYEKYLKKKTEIKSGESGYIRITATKTNK